MQDSIASTVNISEALPQTTSSIAPNPPLENEIFEEMKGFSEGLFLNGRLLLSKLGFSEDQKDFFESSWKSFVQEGTENINLSYQFNQQSFTVQFLSESNSITFKFVFTKGELEYSGNDYLNGKQVLVGGFQKEKQQFYIWVERQEG